MINRLFNGLLIFLLFVNCKSQIIKEETFILPNEHIILNENFFKSIQSNVVKSHVDYLKKEKEAILKTNFYDKKYLNVLESNLKEPYSYYNTTFFDNHLKTTIRENVNNEKVKSIYFINIQTEGNGMMLTYDLILIEGFDYNNDYYRFNNQSLKFKDLEMDYLKLINFTHEFMQNIPYGFEAESVYNMSQSFSIDCVTAVGKNVYEIKSVVVPRMLNYQYSILKSFFFLD